MHLFALKVRLNFLAVGLFSVDVDTDQDFVGKGLKGPPNEGLEHFSRHVDLSEITGSLRM